MFSLVSKCLVAILTFSATVASADLVLYTDRPTSRIAPAAAEFEARTGEKVVIVEAAYKDLYQRMVAERDLGTPQHDLIFVKDMIYLSQLTAEGFFQPSQSAQIAGLTDAPMQAPDKSWTAVTYRARTLVYNPARVNADEIKTYADLADAKYAGMLCLRSGKHDYNVALVSSFIKNLGYEAAKAIVDGMVQNLALDPLKSDNAVIEAIATGQCALGITNSYYLAGYYASNPTFPVSIAFLNQDTTGVHVNGSGVGVASTSIKTALAEQFIALLLEDKFQLQMSAEHLDFPARKGLLPSTFIKDWGTAANWAPGERKFKIDQTNWADIAPLAPEAIKLIEEVNYL